MFLQHKKILVLMLPFWHIVPFNIQITQYGAVHIFLLTLNLANMPKGIRLGYFSDISINLCGGEKLF